MKDGTFTLDDQIAFAELSGDYNPLHVDAIAARRLLFGSPVVHGIHAMLWGLDCWLEDTTDNVELRSIKAVFHKPIRVGEEVSLSFKCENDERLRIELISGESMVSRVDIEWDKSVQRNSGHVEARFPEKFQPRVLEEDQLEGRSGALDLCLNREAAAKMFPHLIRSVSPLQVAVILATTRLVGVKCPGLHSLYSELELSAAVTTEKTAMNYEVTKVDRRFGLVSMRVTAPEMIGVIKAFRRPVPQEQASYLTIKEQVDRHEFVGQRALVIGGSRGLGEVAVKLLSAGGADVKMTYYQGKEDAQRMVDEINSNGGVADSFHFDVLNPKLDPLNISVDTWVPTHLYYFATPFIFSGVKGKFSPKLFNKFCDYYVIGFVNTVKQLSALGMRSIFYPSTVAIDELPTDMGEYAAAKMASEMLCTFLGKTDRKMQIYKPRFPRMATDQTASITPVSNQDPVPKMIGELRSFRNLSIGD